MLALLASASIGDTLTSFFNAVGQFFSDLAAVNWGLLLLGLACFGLNLTLRSRAFFHSLRAAYPAVSFQCAGSGMSSARLLPTQPSSVRRVLFYGPSSRRPTLATRLGLGGTGSHDRRVGECAHC